MDSFAGLGTGRTKRPEQMSLAERRRAAEAQASTTKLAQANNWAGLDMLGGGMSSLSVHGQSTLPNSAATNSLGGKSSPGTLQSQQQAQPRAPSLLDDFDVLVQAPKQPAKPASQSQDDDPFAIFNSTKPALSQLEESQAPKRSVRDFTSAAEYNQWDSQRTGSQNGSRTSSQNGRQGATASESPSQAGTSNDKSLAQLVDMGFEAEDAQRALTAMNGSVKGAINWLMAEAQGTPLPNPPVRSSRAGMSSVGGKGELDDIANMASEIGASMFATASSLWSKGRKQLAKAVDQYNTGGAGSTDGPAWMRSQGKHETRTAQVATEQQRKFDEWRRQQGLDEQGQPVAPSDSSGTPPAPNVQNNRARSEVELPSRPRTSRAQQFREKRESTNVNATESASASSRASSSTPRQSTPVASRGAPQAEVDLLNISAPVSISLSSTQQDMASTSRAAGNEAFKRGDYATAIGDFTTALQSIPTGHNLRAIILSNRAACFVKVGNARSAVDDTVEALATLPSVISRDNTDKIEGSVNLVDLWAKLVTRQAQAYESIEKYDLALANWKLLLDNGHAGPTILEAKRRCLKALEPAAVIETPAAPKSKRRGWGTSGAVPQSAAGKAALQKVRDEHKKQEVAEAERDKLQDSVASRIEKWRQGKEDNLRALLASLPDVLWANSGWTSVSMSDLVAPKKARMAYMKAVARTHPDKVPASASTETKMIAQGVFITINKAWDPFREANGL